MTTNDDSQSKFKSSYRRYRDGAVKGSQTQSVRFQDNLTQTLSNTRHVPVPTPSPRNLERDSSDDDTDSGCGGSEDVQMRRVVPAKPNDLSRFTSSSHSSGGKSTELRELRVWKWPGGKIISQQNATTQLTYGYTQLIEPLRIWNVAGVDANANANHSGL